MSERVRLYYDMLETPLGEMRIVAGADGALRQAGWEMAAADGMEAKAGLFGNTAALRAYFAGEVRAIGGLRTAAAGTEFQRAVWAGLREIGCGETQTYGELAGRLGAGGAARAVGAAAGANPVAIVVPCHRLVGAGGKLTGYAGGLDRKRWLLAHEREARLG